MAALEQEESKYCWHSHRGILSLLKHFQRTWFCRHLPVSQRRVWEVHQCLYLHMCWQPRSFPEVVTLRNRNMFCVGPFTSQQHTTNSSSQPVYQAFYLNLCFLSSMICSVSKSVGSREKKQGRKYAYLGFIFRMPCRTGIPAALDSVQCRQVITCMVCDI